MNTKPIIENRVWQPEFECLPRKQLEALQVVRLREAVARSARVPFFKKKFVETGITPECIKGLDDLRRLPFTLKADLRDHYPMGFLAVPRSEVARYQGTSGTTGKPLN